MKKLTYEQYVERYREIVDDFDSFLKYSTMPLPKIIWTNHLKADVEDIEVLLSGEDYEELSWWKGAFKVTSNFKPGKTIEFLSGQIHAQEEVSMYPVLAMNPKPGEYILDMCAAPGNKSAGICLKMNDKGLLVANDFRSGRIALLQNSMTRLGFSNYIVTQNDGTSFSTNRNFDKILVDAPCSAEGNIRKSKWSMRNENHSLKFQTLQINLLKRAIEMTKSGGAIVYSTCTYSPDENEVVVNANLSEKVELVEIDFPKELNYSPGILKWKDKKFHPGLAKTCRIWPHQNNSGGFYVAKFRKL